MICTERLMLAPYRDEHICAEHLAWLNDRTLMRYSKQRFLTHTEHSQRAYVASFVGTPHHFWALLHDGRLVGTATAYVDVHDRVADVGLLVGVPGQGYGGEAFAAIVAFLFQLPLHLRKITGGTLAANVGMRKIYEAHGLELEGTRRAQELIDGAPVDLLLYGRLR